MSSLPIDNIPVIKTAPATAEERSWIEYARTEHQGTLKRLEETAKYLSGLSSISLTIMLGPNRDLFNTMQHAAWLKAGIISWLLSILFSLVVVFPFRYRYISNSSGSIKSAYRKISGIKFSFLIAGALLYLTGISLVVYLYLFFHAPVVH